MTKLFLAAVFLLIGYSVSALPAFDPFGDATATGGTSYTIGANLTGQTNAQGLAWFAAGSAAGTPVVASGNLTIAGLAPSAGNSISFGAPPVSGTSARLGLAPSGSPFNSGTLYYSFAFQLNSLGSLPTTGAFVAGFNNSTGAQAGQPSVIGARLYTRLSGAGFNFGVNKGDGTAADISWDSGVRAVGDTFFLVGSYTINTGTTTDDSSSLWINPDSSTFGGTAPAATLTASAGADISGNQILSFLIREASTVEPAGMTLDELRVGTSWADVTPTTVPEPASAALLGLALFLVLYRLRHPRHC